jgi:hypothetical protein
MSIVYVTAASLAPRHHPGIDRHEQNPVCVESVWCVSYGSTMLSTWNQGQGSDWSVRGGIDTGPLVGDVQCSIWPMTPVEPSAPPVSVTRVGRVMALRKRNQTQQAEKNQNFKYHFHIPLSHTTAEINQKVVYTTFFREMVNTARVRRGAARSPSAPRSHTNNNNKCRSSSTVRRDAAHISAQTYTGAKPTARKEREVP